MNRRDQELLEKQLHTTYIAPRNDGVLILAVLAVFFAGIALGGFFSPIPPQPGRLCASLRNNTAQISQQQ